MKPVFVVVIVCLLSVVNALAQGAPQKLNDTAVVPAAAPSERFVPMEPCRFLDTRVVPATSSLEESQRTIDVGATACGRFVPKVATAFAIRRTSYNRVQVAPPTATPTSQAPARHPVGAPLHFPFASSEHIALDLEGYFVPPGTPIDPGTTATTSGSSVQSHVADNEVTASSSPSLRVKPQDFAATGSMGQLYLDGSYPFFGSTGFLGVGTSAQAPFNIMKTSTSDGNGGFAVYNSNLQQLMYIRSDGLATFKDFPLNSAYEYRGSVNFPNDAVSSIQAANPKDHLGGNTNPIVFYRAKSLDEAPTGAGVSPATTKFQAFTMGDYDQTHINFDSQVRAHWPAHHNHYHFRAYSTEEAKDTFWVKPTTRGDSTHNTTADMYVSGNVGIGELSPGETLQVNGAVKVTGATATVRPDSASLDYVAGGARIVSFGPSPSAAASFSLVLKSSDALVGSTRFVVDPAGNVGIPASNPMYRLDVGGSGHFSNDVVVGGVINAKYQDVAEWVSAEEGMAAGTVVVVGENLDNTVTASMHAYDTSVAGVVSANPGLLLGVAGESKAKIATTGRVRVRVDATKSPIRKGDLLVTSDRPGRAMKSEPLDIGGVKLHRPGTLIGKALEPLAGGEGEILVLLSLQ